MKTLTFTTISQAKKLTGLSYLGTINSSAKLDHSEIYSHMYTYILYLAPFKLSGYNICPFACPECIKACLNESGRANMDIKSKKYIIRNSRIKKTRLFFENRQFFMDWLIAEILQAKKKAIKDNYFFSIRLNGTSDINFTGIKVRDNKNIYELFPDIQFYDYTKNPNKFKNIPLNYHLTFSYTGEKDNIDNCKKLLASGFNIAVVFSTPKNKSLPNNFLGCEVINGDLTDYRPNDKKNSVIGLHYKKVANKQVNESIFNSSFVVNHNNL
jgi:hypothetical protein